MFSALQNSCESGKPSRKSGKFSRKGGKHAWFMACLLSASLIWVANGTIKTANLNSDGIAYGAAFARGKRDAFILSQMILAQRAAAIADEKMWQEMQVVKVELTRLVRASLIDDQAIILREESLAKWSEKLTALREKNPYLQEEVLKSEFKVNNSAVLKQGESTTLVKVLFDPSFTEGDAERFSKVPPESWREYPGTITAIIAPDCSFIVWAAGIDTRPLRTAPGQVSARTIRGKFLASN